MKTKITLLMIIITMVISTGCWDRRELSQMIIVSAVAIDKTKDNMIRFTIFAPTTKFTTSVAISECGKGIADAYGKIELKLSRQIFLAQIDCIIIGESLARSGVSEILDYFPRFREPPLRAYILFAKGDAADILKTTSTLEKNPTVEIRKLETRNLGITMYLKDFLYALTEEGISPIAPVVQKIPADKNNPENSILMTSISEGAVFNDDKLIGWLNEKEVTGVLWLKNKLQYRVIAVTIPEEKGGGNVGGRIITSKVKVNPLINGDKIELKITIHANTNIGECTSKLDLSSPDSLHYIEGIYAEEIKRIINVALEKVQKQFSTDVFGFGAIVHGKYPKLWESQYKKDWDKNFENLKISIECHVRISQIGFDNKSTTIKEDEFIK